MKEDPYSILNELQKRQHYKPKGRPPFSADQVRYALLHQGKLINYFWIKFSLPSFSLLEKTQSGGVRSITTVKSLMEKVHLFRDFVLLVDEIYLQKGTQFNVGEYIGPNENNHLYKGIMVFIITGQKKKKITVPSVVKTCPEVTVKGEWFSQEILKFIFQLMNSGFFIRAVVADNNSDKVNTFNILLDKFEGDKTHYITLPNPPHKIFIF